jgi:hypothetical protein
VEEEARVVVDVVGDELGRAAVLAAVERREGHVDVCAVDEGLRAARRGSEVDALERAGACRKKTLDDRRSREDAGPSQTR